MPTNEDIADLITTVTAADEQIDHTERAYKLAASHWINKILPWRYRRLRKVKSDIADHRANLAVTKRYINALMRGEPFDI